MPTITVPGAGGAAVTLTFATSASSNLASSLLSAVYAASPSLLNVGTSASSAPITATGEINEFLITSAGSYTVPSGFTYVVDAAASGAVTITGNSGSAETVVGGGGGLLTYNVGAGGGTIDFGAAGSVFNQSATTGGAYTVGGELSTVNTPTSSGGQTGTLPSTGTTQLTGPATVTATGGTVYGSTVAGASNSITNTGTNTTVILTAGVNTINAAVGSSGTFYNSSSGSLTFVNLGQSTIVGIAGAGASTVFSGSGNSVLYEGGDAAFTGFVNFGGANDSLVAGSTGGNLVGYNSSGGTVNIFGGVTTTAPDYLVGINGSETLSAAFATGQDVLFGAGATMTAYLSSSATDAYWIGSGAQSVLGGTGPGDIFVAVSGSAGGSAVLYNWTSSDTFVFGGYGASGDTSIKAALAAAPVANVVSITLPDNTKITIVGASGSNVNLASGSGNNFYS